MIVATATNLGDAQVNGKELKIMRESDLLAKVAK